MRLPVEGGPRQVEIDFGPLPVTQAAFLLADAGVTLATIVKGSVAFEPPTGPSDVLTWNFGAVALPAGLSLRVGCLWTEE